MLRPLTILFLSLLPVLALGQNIEIRKTDQQIIIDGELDDAAWQMADSAYNFMQQFPADTSLANAQTIAKILYDDQYIYVSAIMFNLSKERSYFTPSLRRDFFGDAVDSFSIIFDTFQDETNGFIFGINPYGVRREGLLTNGGTGREGFSLDWDNKWLGESVMHEGYWTTELAIPLKTLRFNEGQKEWNINFYRIDSEEAEKSTWTPISVNFSIINLANLKKGEWQEPTEKPGSNISFIPYAAAGISKNIQDNEEAKTNFDVGFDLKYAVTPGLNLDLTVNPDFSQVEVDRQVTNLDRFEIFFPERRQFFLENADLFANYGNRGTRPFFSRRIGITRDESTGQNIQTAIPFGARLSGKVNDNLRIGVLNMQDAQDKEIGAPSYNYSMLSLQQKVFARSNVSFFAVNKQTFMGDKDYDAANYNEWNRTFGADFNLQSADNKWNGKVFLHHSFDKVQPDDAYATGVSVNYNVTNWSVNVFSQAVGKGFNPEVGFVRRRDIQQLAQTTKYRIFPKKGKIQTHGPGFDFDLKGNNKVGWLDWDMNFLYDITWKSSAKFTSRLRREYVYLTDDFDPSGSGGIKLPAGSDYTFNLIIARYESDRRKRFSYNISTRSGQYFNGTRVNFEGELQFRYQPIGFTSLTFAYNRIRLPDPYSSSNLFLIGPRFDFTFTKNLFWTTFVQYNSQIDNVNINSRLQWRFAPVSDIFLVYTDNYLATNDNGFINFGASKSRALVFKMTYWLNF